MRSTKGGAAALSLVLSLAWVWACSTDAAHSGLNASTASAAGSSSADMGAASKSPSIDSSWVEYTTTCDFSFFAPPGFMLSEAAGADSCTVGYEGGDCMYWGDYGAFSGAPNLSDQPGYRETMFELDGQPVKLVAAGPRSNASSPFIAGFRIERSPGRALSFVAYCNSAEGLDLATRVLPTVRFTN